MSDDPIAVVWAVSRGFLCEEAYSIRLFWQWPAARDYAEELKNECVVASWEWVSDKDKDPEGFWDGGQEWISIRTMEVE